MTQLKDITIFYAKASVFEVNFKGKKCLKMTIFRENYIILGSNDIDITFLHNKPLPEFYLFLFHPFTHSFEDPESRNMF